MGSPFFYARPCRTRLENAAFFKRRRPETFIRLSSIGYPKQFLRNSVRFLSGSCGAGRIAAHPPRCRCRCAACRMIEQVGDIQPQLRGAEKRGMEQIPKGLHQRHVERGVLRHHAAIGNVRILPQPAAVNHGGGQPGGVARAVKERVRSPGRGGPALVMVQMHPAVADIARSSGAKLNCALVMSFPIARDHAMLP